MLLPSSYHHWFVDLFKTVYCDRVQCCDDELMLMVKKQNSGLDFGFGFYSVLINRFYSLVTAAESLHPLSKWPPRSARPGSRWAGVWDITTRCVSCDWLHSCVAEEGRLCYQAGVWGGLLFAFGCAGTGQEQLGHCTGFPLFMWGCGFTSPGFCCTNCNLLYHFGTISELTGALSLC